MFNLGSQKNTILIILNKFSFIIACVEKIDNLQDNLQEVKFISI